VSNPSFQNIKLLNHDIDLRQYVEDEVLLALPRQPVIDLTKQNSFRTACFDKVDEWTPKNATSTTNLVRKL
jgi:uncharacterized metal-binding protein YceD (DUF177 family)